MLMVKEDYLMRQIQMVSDGLAKTLLNRERTVHEMTDPYRNEAANDLNKRLMDLLAESKFDEAENLLFEAVENDEHVDNDYFPVALDFYLKLNQYNDDYLELCDFSREEADDGWAEVTKLI